MCYAIVDLTKGGKFVPMLQIEFRGRVRYRSVGPAMDNAREALTVAQNKAIEFTRK